MQLFMQMVSVRMLPHVNDATYMSEWQNARSASTTCTLQSAACTLHLSPHTLDDNDCMLHAACSVQLQSPHS